MRRVGRSLSPYRRRRALPTPPPHSPPPPLPLPHLAHIPPAPLIRHRRHPRHRCPQPVPRRRPRATPPPTPPPAPPVPTPPLPFPHEHPPRRLAATHAVAALTPLPTALQLASKDDAAYSLDSPANVSRLRLRLAHGMVRWYLTTRCDEAAACGVSHPFCAVSHCGSAQTQKEASETSRLAQQLCRCETE